jgi:hypothetical protein
MRKWKLAAAATAASGALAIGMFAAFSLTAKAQPAAGTCTDSYTGTVAAASALKCTYAAGTPVAGASNYPALADPQTITVSANTAPQDLDITYTWKSTCVENGNPISDSSPAAGTTVAGGGGLTFGYRDLGLLSLPTTCDFDVTATIANDAANVKANYLLASSLIVQVSYTQSVLATPTATTASPTPSASKTTTAPKVYNNQVHGFDGMCMNDHFNSSAVRAQIVVWQCNNKNPAQGWTFSNSELKIHGLCLNAKGNGKQNSKLILWSCNGSGNEVFTHKSNGEFVEKANGGTLCLNDPGFSTKNGTQLIVFKCKNTANEHWTKP